MASEDAVYRESSQFRLWSFSPAQLDTLRTQTNALARVSIEDRRRLSQADEKDRGGGGGSDGDKAATATATTATPTPTPTPTTAYLTPAEERLLLDFYTVELLRAGQFMNQPTEVQATAAVFLRRFYVTHSIMTYPPAALFKTALFFGAKSEGYYHTLDGFAEKFPNTTAADILAGEFLLCQGIRFAFDVKHPFRGLEGAIMELRRLADAEAEAEEGNSKGEKGDGNDDDRLSDSRLAAAHRRAREILKFSPLVTDAYFHYTPSQIMLAALWLADRGLVERLLLRDVFRRPDDDAAAAAAAGAAAGSKKKRAAAVAEAAAEWERTSGAAVRERVLATVAACSRLLATEPPERFTAYWGQPESNNLIKPLLKKLKACRDPDRFNLVALQQAKKEGAVKTYHTGGSAADGAVFQSGGGGEHEAKRRRTAKALDDPFGPPL